MESMVGEKIKSYRIEEEIQEKAFSCGDILDDVYDWSYKLAALGRIMEALVYHEQESNYATEVLETSGEWLGSIIADYARAIRISLDNNMKNLRMNEESVVTPLPRAQELLNYFKSKERLDLSDITPINYQIKEIDEFVQSALVGYDIKAEYKKLLNSIQDAQDKKASAN